MKSIRVIFTLHLCHVHIQLCCNNKVITHGYCVSLESIRMDKVEMKNDDIYEWVVGGKSFLGAKF